ncbi:ImmA/IrrE family metallo-endopeptidase [Paraclostridium bifermentans]|uniref:ImmA/IrrE family metallo-endopeptidase n=1 Tax=Paraclostridium bifermentans TaxID=1490 RepID=UPI0021C3D588|nr:ImmA/IrrE family metallo-endopeptidase [Paraclostridium bifermentans]GKZ04035.1 ImmA/IrrE family metallo-endopeptidase [Paraclostridium bifermentans]GKZ05589.1 ImmA/IrrE family metallo-endopeptidase [Paraclostridium bifermentans]GKZ11221.1 ImmA/IrrE family metallo-endopeptidase [Paraclostridium bifermentans]
MESKKIYDIVEQIVDHFNTDDPEILCDKLGLEIKNVNYGKSYFVGDNLNLVFINKNYGKLARKIVLAHELGHFILHKRDNVNYFRSTQPTIDNSEKERQANLFAAYMLFSDKFLKIKFADMTNYLLESFFNDLTGELN